jgi:tetratricopeptide (TPR) repeat protein
LNLDWAGVDKNFLRGLELNPNSAYGHMLYATNLSIICRNEEALRHIRIAVELDPTSNSTLGQYALILTNARKFDEAIRQASEVISLDPGFEVGYFRLAWALWGAGRYDEAVSTMQKALSLFSKSQFPWKVFAAELYAHSGRKDSARKLLTEIERNAGERYLSATQIASIYVGLREMDEALRWLWRAFDSRDPELLGELTNPQFDKVRNDPRIQELLKRMNAPESVYHPYKE